jgi:hypothetical protein
MDQTFLLALVVAIVFAMVALARMITRPPRPAGEGAADSPIAVSTEGMKICASCGMGNLWTERQCSSCGAALKG